jgi:flagellar motor switch protein FliM
MTEVLSQDEIDQLLTAISSGDVEPEEVHQPSDQRKIKIYDFKRPDKFSKEQIRTVSIMHETFARLTTTSLSAQLRSLVQVHVASVDQLTYEEFIRSIPNPTTLAVINMDPLKGSAILEIDPAITFSIIDRLFGGQGEGTKVTRDLTDIEQSVMEGIIVRVLGNMREAWSQVIDLRPRLGQIETNPQFAQIVPPTEMVVLVTLETKVGDVEGMMNFCIPYLTIEPIISKLSAQYWYSSVRRGTTTENLNILRERLSTIEVAVVAEIGAMDLTVRDVLSLRAGDVIRLQHTRTRDPMIVKVGNRPKFLGKPGLVGNKLAVQIIKQLEDIEQEEFEELAIEEGETL